MSDRLWLFIFSVLMIVGGLAASAWLIISGQALTVDGLFLLLVALLAALVFALYLKFLIGNAMKAAKPAAAPAKPAAAKPAAKPTPAAVSE